MPVINFPSAVADGICECRAARAVPLDVPALVGVGTHLPHFPGGVHSATTPDLLKSSIPIGSNRFINCSISSSFPVASMMQ